MNCPVCKAEAPGLAVCNDCLAEWLARVGDEDRWRRGWDFYFAAYTALSFPERDRLYRYIQRKEDLWELEEEPIANRFTLRPSEVEARNLEWEDLSGATGVEREIEVPEAFRKVMGEGPSAEFPWPGVRPPGARDESRLCPFCLTMETQEPLCASCTADLLSDLSDSSAWETEGNRWESRYGALPWRKKVRIYRYLQRLEDLWEERYGRPPVRFTLPHFRFEGLSIENSGDLLAEGGASSQVPWALSNVEALREVEHPYILGVLHLRVTRKRRGESGPDEP